MRTRCYTFQKTTKRKRGRVAGISDEDIQKVRDASDLVAVIGERTPVKQKGRDFWCCCPLHQEKTPSFKIDPATQLWHCFGCGEGGDVFSFIMKTEDFNFPEAVRYLADRAHIDIAEDARGGGMSRSVKSRMKEICARTAEFYHTQLMRGRGEGPDADNLIADKSIEYLLTRNGLPGLRRRGAEEVDARLRPGTRRARAAPVGLGLQTR